MAKADPNWLGWVAKSQASTDEIATHFLKRQRHLGKQQQQRMARVSGCCVVEGNRGKCSGMEEDEVAGVVLAIFILFTRVERGILQTARWRVGARGQRII